MIEHNGLLGNTDAAGKLGLLISITGKVQGVGYRKFVAQAANELAITGSVHNCDDGTVRVLAHGDLAQILAFLAKLQLGHARAEVNLLQLYPATGKASEFKIYHSLKPAKPLSLPAAAPRVYTPHEGTLITDDISSSDLTSINNDEQAVAFFKQVLQQRAANNARVDNKVNELLGQLSVRYPTARQQLLQQLADHATFLNANHTIVKSAARFGGLAAVSSFKAMLVARTRKQQLTTTGSCHEWALNDKISSYNFLDLLGVRRPELYHKNVKIEQLKPRKGVAIKPVAGAAARGVYLAYDDGDILDVKASEKLTDWSMMQARMRANIKRNYVKRDAWLVEELILGDSKAKTPSVDLKFLCFYGEIALVREISRYPETLDCWWDVNGDAVDTGQRLNAERLLQGKGVTAEQLALVKSISEQIPAPFIRIDFLLSDGELVFGEFTPRPGSFAQFNEQTDRMLGDCFLAAEARLVNDLLNGKTFPVYKEYLASIKKR